MKQYEYKTAIYEESALSSILLGNGKINKEKFDTFLNEQAKAGWRFKNIEKEMRRKFGFWAVEAMVVVFEREKTPIENDDSPIAA
ncbi:DUF4177 domain-containing protein [bacterium DOLZORAL124_38_8]|nr:MAG: DUF4177 domain-containing protein [bacterium DOLZORAL124_38_8]